MSIWDGLLEIRDQLSTVSNAMHAGGIMSERKGVGGGENGHGGSGMKHQSRPIRVLHVLGAMARGGIETWLLHVLRQRSLDVEHSLCLTKAEPGPYEDECCALGIPIHRAVWRHDPLRWAGAFHRVLAEAGPFDVVHSHAHLFSGLVLPTARVAGVPRRIAHSHTVMTNERTDHPLRRLYEAAMLLSIRLNATHGLGISRLTTADMFGADWSRRAHVRRLLYGFDFSRYEQAVNRARAVRERFGLTPTTPILGHVGRFIPFKNHAFLLDVFAEVARRSPDVRFLLVGSGPLEAEIRTRVDRLGLSERVIFAGETDDVAAYMAAMDVFVMPSWTEGLGIVLVEAQAAGTPVVMTDTMPEEVDLWPGQVDRIGLTAEAATWAETALAAAARSPERRQGYEAVMRSPFNIDRCLVELAEVYGAGPEAPVEAKSA